MMKTMKAYFACLEIDINNVDSHATLYSHIQTNKKGSGHNSNYEGHDWHFRRQKNPKCSNDWRRQNCRQMHQQNQTEISDECS